MVEQAGRPVHVPNLLPDSIPRSNVVTPPQQLKPDRRVPQPQVVNEHASAKNKHDIEWRIAGEKQRSFTISSSK